MCDHLGLLVPVVDSLIASFLTLAKESLTFQWSALYLALQLSYFSDLPLKMLVPVRIDNSLPQETQAQGWDLNPEPTFLRAAGPMDQGPACLRFFRIELLQAEAPAKSQSQNTCTSLTMVAPKEEPLKLPNRSRDSASVNFMSLKSSQVTNQTLLPKINPGFGPDPVITAKNQENRVTKLDILTNERTPS
ncbi:hypothetical protein DSO57_1037513 [Entomophthora muscae]|uniref:Uncharacterized protein n=1 Tax=Entomophthora muscae TaxID=34485 RepID=A0ACC2RPT9_9FUNG|nr:hypothetical protein DSO57_1037513 [Entomophthora muscae]